LKQDVLSVDVAVSDEAGESVKMSLQYQVLEA